MKIGIGGLPKSDLDEVLLNCTDLWDSIRESRLLLLGGTGFIGSWLIATLLNANRELSLGLKLTVLTRDSKRARERFAEKDLSGTNFVEHDLKSGAEINLGFQDFAIHAATPSVPQPGFLDKSAGVNSTIGGIHLIGKQVLEENPDLRFIHLSSGAVYGQSNSNLFQFFEKDVGFKNGHRTDYGNLKFHAERLGMSYFAQKREQIGNPRLFSFIGPLLALDQHFAVGNFLLDGLNGHAIEIKGNPQSMRSYMYPTDLVTWLLHILVTPNARPLNIGGEETITMFDLASLIASRTQKQGITILNPNAEINCYWPSTQETQKIYKIEQQVSLEDGITRWMAWLKSSQSLKQS